MRAIDGDALDDFLASAEIEAVNKQKYVLAGALNTIRENLRNFPSAQPEPQWIPCSERLPENNEDVLLQFARHVGIGFHDYYGWAINTGDGIFSELGKNEENPVAWMPIPERLKG